MTDVEFFFWWVVTFAIWNVYYLWVVPKRAAHFWAERFKTKKGKIELVQISEPIIDAVVEQTDLALQEALETFKQSFFGSLGKNVQETKSLLKMANPESELLEKIGSDNPIMGLIISKLQPQLQGLFGGQGVSGGTQEGFKKGL